MFHGGGEEGEGVNALDFGGVKDALVDRCWDWDGVVG